MIIETIASPRLRAAAVSGGFRIALLECAY